MSVKVKFHAPSGVVTLDLAKISNLQITRQRNTCEILATTPENPHPQVPYSIARRDKEYELNDIIHDLQELKKDSTADIIFEITDSEVHRIKKI
jgi:hypothetical protein